MRGQRLPEEAISFLAFLDAQLTKGRRGAVRNYAHSANPSVGAPHSPRNDHIEGSLMKKHRLAQFKLMTLKAQAQADELLELQSAPTINPLSRKLAESVERPQLYSSPKKKQSLKNLKAEGKPQESENTLTALSASKSEGVIAPAFQLRCHVNLEEGTTSHVFPAVRAGKEDDIRVCARSGVGSIESLRKEVMERYHESAQLEPPPDLLDMPVLARQDYFLERRTKNIQRQRAIQAQEEQSHCTFRPQLNVSRSASSIRSEKSTRSLSAPRRPASYYERYMHSKSLKNSLNRSASNLRSESLENCSSRRKPAKLPIPVLYVPLSPTQQRISFKSGLNLTAFLSSAKPMMSYHNVDIQKAMEMPRSLRGSNRSKRP